MAVLRPFLANRNCFNKDLKLYHFLIIKGARWSKYKQFNRSIFVPDKNHGY